MNIDDMSLVSYWQSKRPDAFPADVTFGQALPIAEALEAERDAQFDILMDDTMSDDYVFDNLDRMYPSSLPENH